MTVTHSKNTVLIERAIHNSMCSNAACAHDSAIMVDSLIKPLINKSVPRKVYQFHKGNLADLNYELSAKTTPPPPPPNTVNTSWRSENHPPPPIIIGLTKVNRHTSQ